MHQNKWKLKAMLNYACKVGKTCKVGDSYTELLCGSGSS